MIQMHSNKCYKSPFNQSPYLPHLKDITCNLHASKEIIKIIQKQESEEIMVGEIHQTTLQFSAKNFICKVNAPWYGHSENKETMTR